MKAAELSRESAEKAREAAERARTFCLEELDVSRAKQGEAEEQRDVATSKMSQAQQQVHLVCLRASLSVLCSCKGRAPDTHVYMQTHM